jgi:hypothetical protein
MKTLVALLACLSLASCVANTDSSDPDSSVNVTVDDSINLPPNGPGSSGFGCDRVDFVHVVVDGHAYWVQVPTLCNPNPDIYKGDPGPDEGDPYDTRANPETTQAIMEQLNARFATSGGARSSAVQ